MDVFVHICFLIFTDGTLVHSGMYIVRNNYLHNVGLFVHKGCFFPHGKLCQNQNSKWKHSLNLRIVYERHLGLLAVILLFTYLPGAKK